MADRVRYEDEMERYLQFRDPITGTPGKGKGSGAPKGKRWQIGYDRPEGLYPISDSENEGGKGAKARRGGWLTIFRG